VEGAADVVDVGEVLLHVRGVLCSVVAIILRAYRPLDSNVMGPGQVPLELALLLRRVTMGELR
jgi:hypothetical protein